MGISSHVFFKKIISEIPGIILVGLLSVGLFKATSVSYLTVIGVAPCPTVLNIPACFLVTLGYFMMLIATIFRHRLISIKQAKWLFIVGWSPVVLLALAGSLLEFIQGETCPRGDTGIPLCYISLSVAVSVVFLYWFKTTRWHSNV